jgi:hypothetical protein
MAARKAPAKKAPAKRPAAKKAPSRRAPAAAKKDEPATLATEVASGDERRALVAMRDHLATKMEGAEPAVVAQIAGRLQAVITRIGELGGPKDGSKADELKARRERRRAEG